MGYKATVQILLVVVSIVIIVTYIKPTFGEMKATQDETKEYDVALSNAEAFNAELQRLLDTASSYGTTELRELKRYVPDEVDPVLVMRDIQTIVEKNAMTLTALSSDGGGLTVGNSVQNVQADPGELIDSSFNAYSEQFSVGVSGTYQQMKLLLQDFEQNAYPLEVMSLSFTADDTPFYTFDIVLETYALTGENNEVE